MRRGGLGRRLKSRAAPLYERAALRKKRAGDLDAATDLARKAVTWAPHKAGWHHELGLLLRDQGDHVAAAEALATAVALVPDRPKWHAELGEAYRHAGDLDAAIAAYRNAIGRHPRNAAWQHRIADLLSRRGDHAAAAESLTAAIAVVPDRPRWHGELADAYRGAGDVDAAIATYRGALQRWPDHGAWQRELGLLLRGRDEFVAAAAALAAAVALEPDRPRWRAELGDAYRRAGDVDAAIEAYRGAVERQPGHGGWQHELGLLLRRRGDHGEAAQALAEAVAVEPDRPRWRAELGDAYRRAGDVDAAVEAYRGAIEREPTHVAWHYQLGRIFEQVNDPSSARAAYLAGLRVEPDPREEYAAFLQRSPWRFPVRRQLFDFVADHIEAIKDRAEPTEQRLTDLKIHVYWAQGIADAPAVVQRCVAELRRLHPDGEVLLHDQSVWERLEIPEVTMGKIRERLTHGSDVLRMELLYRYGGVWMDATCLLRRPLPDLVPKLAPTGFFAFERAPYRLSNWMIVSAPGHYLAGMLRATLHAYWAEYDRVVDYYLFHHLFEALCEIDPQFRQAWEATPRLSADDPHRFHDRRFEPYDPVLYRDLLDSCFVAKLSYKGMANMSPDSMMAWFLEHGPPDPS